MGVMINLYYQQWIDLTLSIFAIMFGFYLANKEKNIKGIKYGEIEVFDLAKKNTFFCQIENNKFENVKNSLIEQYKPKGYNISIDLPNIIKLSTNDSYLQLKNNIGNNNLTLETLNTEMPNIVKDLSKSDT
jgi:hypothetical protein